MWQGLQVCLLQEQRPGLPAAAAAAALFEGKTHRMWTSDHVVYTELATWTYVICALQVAKKPDPTAKQPRCTSARRFGCSDISSSLVGTSRHALAID